MKLIALILLATFTLTLRAATTAPAPTIPPAEADAKARLNASPRHGEYIDVDLPDAKNKIRCYIVYPERADKAPVALVIMEIFGLSDWLRATADQLAADGFIAIAPDFLTGKGPNGGGTDAFASRDDVVKAVRLLKPEEVIAGLNAARDYALKQPSANGKSASIGFCWGGSQSFAYAAAQPSLNAAAVFYGTAPADDQLPKIKCPVAGFYGKDDARITATVDPTTKKMADLKLTYSPHIYEGAGHGFMRDQTTRNGANQKAANEAWPAAIQFLKDNTKQNP